MGQPERHRRILLVEDDLALAKLYRLKMEEEGFEVLECHDGERALQTALEFGPDLILLDIMMPKIDGFAVLDILRNTPETKAVKIVVLTARGGDDDYLRAKSMGADEYLVKFQVVTDDVLEVVRRLLHVSAKSSAEDKAA